MIWLIGWVKTEFELNRVQSKLLMILYTWQQLRMVPLVWSSIQDGWMLPHMLWPRVILLRPETAGPPEALICIVSIASLSFWRWGSKLPFQIAAQYSKWGTIAFLLTINWGEGVGNGKILLTSLTFAFGWPHSSIGETNGTADMYCSAH